MNDLCNNVLMTTSCPTMSLLVQRMLVCLQTDVEDRGQHHLSIRILPVLHTLHHRLPDHHFLRRTLIYWNMYFKIFSNEMVIKYTFSYIELVFWYNLNVFRRNSSAILRANSFNFGRPVFSNPSIIIWFNGGHALGKSHCCPVRLKLAGIPFGKSNAPEFCKHHYFWYD